MKKIPFLSFAKPVTKAQVIIESVAVSCDDVVVLLSLVVGRVGEQKSFLVSDWTGLVA